MNFDIIPEAPLHAQVRDRLTKVLFLVIWIGAGGLMYIGVREVFGEQGFLHALFSVVVCYGSFYIATKTAQSFEEAQIKKTEVWDNYWYAYWDKVESLEKQIKEFPEDGREYDKECLKRELKYMQGIEERYNKSHR